ncbi:hypothetical protein [Aliihoeflea sp. PC F10.4]
MRTAIFAAFMLFVQLLVGGFALGTAAAAPPMLDIFGNPLCITSADHDGDEDGKGHTGLPDCCAPGCTMFAPVKSADRAPLALSNPLEAPVACRPMAVAIVGPADAEHEPGNPRAPPLHA